MERDARRHVDAGIFDSDQVTDLTPILNLVALIISIILCFLLSVAI
ncbi:MAG TPA: hypothetical protein VLZ10_02950 [Thermodesulfobacteriota bacterium]|nr:hypothetical protein [Thermodesulfobacteriota bacterium]